MKSSNSKLAIAAFIAASFFATMPTIQSLANNTNPVVATQTAQPTINVKVLGQQDEFVILEIDLNQPIDQNSKLSINDERGEGMYEENVSGKTFSRKIKVVPSEIGKMEIVFSTPNIDIKKTYSINVALISKVNVTEIAKF
jgi:hypothetical protein